MQAPTRKGPVTLTKEPQALACSSPRTHPYGPKSQARFLQRTFSIPPLPPTSPPPGRVGAGGRAYIDTEECSHAVQVVGVPRHGQDLGDDSSMGPFLPKLLHQLLQVAGGRLSDGVDCGRREGGRFRR